jgi:trichohyalin
MEISAVVSKKDETTGENKLTNIKITKGSPATPANLRKKSFTPTKPSPMKIQVNQMSSAKKKEIQLKAMKNWNITDTEGSETTESDDQPKEKTASPQKAKLRSPSKSPDKSVKDEPKSPFKSPKKKLESQKSDHQSPDKKLKLNFDLPQESELEESISKEKSSIEEQPESDHAAEEVDEMEEDDGGLQDDDFEDDEDLEQHENGVGDEPDSKTAANGAESDEDSDEAPEEVSLQTSKKTVSKIIQQEVEAIHHLSLAKKEKQLRREERKKEESIQKKKLGVDARIELLPQSVLEQLQGKNDNKEVDGEIKKKKKKRNKKKNRGLMEDEMVIKPKSETHLLTTCPIVNKNNSFMNCRNCLR